jgi:hypothetical protein
MYTYNRIAFHQLLQSMQKQWQQPAFAAVAAVSQSWLQQPALACH